jgi:hypothetical protein
LGNPCTSDATLLGDHASPVQHALEACSASIAPSQQVAGASVLPQPPGMMHWPDAQHFADSPLPHCDVPETVPVALTTRFTAGDPFSATWFELQWHVRSGLEQDGDQGNEDAIDASA